MANGRITIDKLSDAITERLDLYRTDTAKKVFRATDKTVKRLVRITKKRAPRHTGYLSGDRRPGTFAKEIRGKTENGGVSGSSGVWYVGGKEYRLTHLLVHGHQLRQGGRAAGDDFLEKSVDEVAAEYVKELEEALKDD